ncbi:MAG: hypothetical protein JEZ00_15660 [Anaerolineaceae bacterium]|nr:hypothetical protein [Anaerolineaceae bacterium]
MIKPVYVKPDDEVTTVANIFSSRVVVKGKTWLPFSQIFTGLLMSYLALKRIPQRTLIQSLGIGAMAMPVVLGSEWGHNFAHATAAHCVGKPVDAIRIVWGMPILVYYDVNDQQVAPRQHIIRALGGPLFNMLLLPFALLAKRISKESSAMRDIANAATATNAFIVFGGLLPIPIIDGGAILKWSLVETGHSIPEADITVRKVNGMLGIGLVAATIETAKKKRWIWSVICAMFAVSALGVALGILKEQE